MVAKIFLRGCLFPKTFPTLAKYFVVPYILVCPQATEGGLTVSLRNGLIRGNGCCQIHTPFVAMRKTFHSHKANSFLAKETFSW